MSGPSESFRYTQDEFDIDHYDEIWFFGDCPAKMRTNSRFRGQIELPEYGRGRRGARIVAEWKDRGGGEFAAGDHTLLGASMCRRIPRVRTLGAAHAQTCRRQRSPPSRDARARRARTDGLGGDERAQRIYSVLRRDARRPIDLLGTTPIRSSAGPTESSIAFPITSTKGPLRERGGAARRAARDTWLRLDA